MKIACISDIHGNAPGLEAVLRDIASRNIDTVICAGDLVGFGPYPNEVVSLLKKHKITTVMGNYDDKVLQFPKNKKEFRCTRRPDRYQSFRWTYEHLTPASVAFLATLPFCHKQLIAGYKLLMSHGSPHSYNDFIHATVTPVRLKQLLNGYEPDIFVTGHTHIPFAVEKGDILVVGSGSAGKPVQGSPEVSYVLLELGAKRSYQVIYVSYDVTALCHAILTTSLPAHFADQFRYGQGH